MYFYTLLWKRLQLLYCPRQQVLTESNATPQVTVAPTVNVEAGPGNASMSLSVFSPQTVEISVGESVTWINPTKVPEPHTVTFVMSNETYAKHLPHLQSTTPPIYA